MTWFGVIVGAVGALLLVLVVAAAYQAGKDAGRKAGGRTDLIYGDPVPPKPKFLGEDR